jgi:hypothetical protein
MRLLALIAAVAAPHLTVSPAAVTPGHVVIVRGTADGCPVGDAVTIISGAFAHTHDFAGQPAIFARVRAGGKFGIRTRIPPTKGPGKYDVTARCAGGNLGVLVRLTVRR